MTNLAGVESGVYGCPISAGLQSLVPDTDWEFVGYRDYRRKNALTKRNYAFLGVVLLYLVFIGVLASIVGVLVTVVILAAVAVLLKLISLALLAMGRRTG